jgi:hypothetical protein
MPQVLVANTRFKLESRYYALPLGGVELGIEWLQELGTYLANHQEHFIKLYGFNHHPPKSFHHDQMEKLIKKGAPAYLA